MWAPGEMAFQAGNSKCKGINVQHPCSTNRRKASVADTGKRGEIVRNPDRSCASFEAMLWILGVILHSEASGGV